MKKGKTFDCLGMKRALQTKLHKQWAGLTTAQIQARIKADLAASQTDLAKWWRRIQKGEASSGARGGKAAG